MMELPSVGRERRLRSELETIREIMQVVAAADERPSSPTAIPIKLSVFAAGIAQMADAALRRR